MLEYRIVPWNVPPTGEGWVSVAPDSGEFHEAIVDLVHDPFAAAALEQALLEAADPSDSFGSDVVATIANLAGRGRCVLYRRTIVVELAATDSGAGPAVDLAELAGPDDEVAPTETYYELQLLDAIGDPIPDLDVRFASEQDPIRTNGEGVARFERRASGASVGVVLHDVESARGVLYERWADGRDDGLAGQGILVRHLPDAAEGFTIDPEERIIVALVPRIVRVRLIGMHFDTAKCFMLPSSMNGIRRLVQIYAEYPNARVLIVGHTDTEGSDEANEALSLERADAVASYLTDVVDDWLPWYGDDKPANKRWGTREDQHMLSVLPDETEPYYSGEIHGKKDGPTDAAIRSFQTDEGLKVDGIAGPNTRRALITRYMEKDGTTLPDGVELTTHGCAEYFPEEDLGDEVESDANRRVEMFVFEGPIVPPPPGKISARNSPEYPLWRSQVTKTIDFTGEGGPVVSGPVQIFLHDADGQRMPHAPYRLRAADGDIRTGFADEEGEVLVYDFSWNTLCEVRWGTLEDAYHAFPPHEDEDAEIFYIFVDVIFLGPDPGWSDYFVHLLRNLGYSEAESDARAAFAGDYGADDDDLIEKVQATGQPKPVA